MKKIKILFQGDSITDAGRDKRNYFDLGAGYPKYAAEQMMKDHPDVAFTFINLGISGNRTCQLFDRLYKDGIELQPDVISILIGINDVWHRYGSGRIETTDAQIALNYRAILERLKAQTDAKIVMIAPYLLDCEDKDPIREDLKTLLPIVRGLAKEFADVYIPLDELFDEALKTQPEPRYYSGDGVHPNKNGAAFIGAEYAKAIKPLIEAL
ncbi:MAG: GDSL family lipase [Ruminococcaceae bacterium]|nr:GDSL family lipase [Oscillospiraceae bacterium]